ncbi:MAG: hypothetical protein HY694_00900 [Deltaproteobacteria bacterium]|nr:hypothetical protein [Deltaproteobacteria bacterium]
MSETATNPFQPFFDEIRWIVREEIGAVMDKNGHSDEDRLLDAEQAGQLLGMSRYWLYRHARKLPFARKLGPKNLRFSYQGIQKYLATRKVS